MLYEMTRPASPVPFTVRDGPPFDYRFIEDLREFICLRLDKVNPYKESKEYCLQQEKASRLCEEVQRMLPEEGRDLLVAYSDALGAAHYLEVAILAERAFLDGIRIVLRAVGEEWSGSSDFQPGLRKPARRGLGDILITAIFRLVAPHQHPSCYDGRL